MTVIVQRLTDESTFEEVGRVEDGEITAGEDALTAIDREEVWTGMSPDELTARFDGPYIMAAIRPTDGEREQTTQEAIGIKQTPEGVPDGYVYVSPDEEVGDEYDVVESDAGGTYRSPEPVDDAGVSDDFRDGWEDVTTHDLMSQDASDVRDAAEEYLAENTSVGEVSIRDTRPEFIREMGMKFKSLDDAFDLSGIDRFGDNGDVGNFGGADMSETAGYFAADAGMTDDEVQVVVKPKSYNEPSVFGVDDEDWMVTNDRFQTVTHEVAHYLHFQEFAEQEDDPRLAWDRYYDELSDDEEQALSGEVSEYASTNAFEAVAEIATGLMYGKEFSDEVMDIYDAHGGPDVTDMGFEETAWDEEPDHETTLEADGGEPNPWLVEAEMVERSFRRWAGVDDANVSFKQTPEGVPENYIYYPPDEEPPEDHDVVQSPDGATYASPVPADELEDGPADAPDADADGDAADGDDEVADASDRAGTDPQKATSDAANDAAADMEREVADILGSDPGRDDFEEAEQYVADAVAVEEVDFSSFDAAQAETASAELARMNETGELDNIDSFRSSIPETDRATDGQMPAHYDRDGRGMSVDPNALGTRANQRLSEAGVTSTPSETHMMEHIAALTEHIESLEQGNGEADEDTSIEEAAEETDTDLTEVAAKVGQLSVATTATLVAETYVMARNGYPQPEQVGRLYRFLGGPELSDFRGGDE